MLGTTLIPSEVIGLVLCVLVLIYVIYNNKTLLTGKYAFITYGFLCITGSFFLTNLEEFFFEDLVNIVEHTLLAAGAFYVAVGCRRILLGSADDSGKTS